MYTLRKPFDRLSTRSLFLFTKQPLNSCFCVCLLASFAQVLIGNLTKPKEGLDALMPSRTQLSPYLRFGCLSPRLFHMRLTKAYMKVFSLCSLYKACKCQS